MKDCRCVGGSAEGKKTGGMGEDSRQKQKFGDAPVFNDGDVDVITKRRGLEGVITHIFRKS